MLNTPVIPINEQAHSYPIPLPIPDSPQAPWATSESWKEHHDRIISALAHEVRNPLANINLSVEMLEAATEDGDRKVYQDIIMRNTLRINNLIEGLLRYQPTDISKTENYSVYRLLDEALEISRDRILLRNVLIKRTYTATDCQVTVNVAKMKIALTNLIINAIDAMTGRKGILTLATQSLDGKYIVHVEDNGCGISPENMKHISTAFFTTKASGLGLGLSTTYDVFRSNNVGVNVESTEGTGTRFILLFNKY